MRLTEHPTDKLREFGRNQVSSTRISECVLRVGPPQTDSWPNSKQSALTILPMLKCDFLESWEVILLTFSKRIALLRYNSYTIKFNILKYKIQWF